MSLSKSKTSEKSTESEKFDPEVQALMMGHVRRAQGIADRPFPTYSGQRVSGFTPTGNVARDMTLRAAGVRNAPPALRPGQAAPSAPPSTASAYAAANADVQDAWGAMDPGLKSGMGWSRPDDFYQWHLDNRAGMEGRSLGAPPAAGTAQEVSYGPAAGDLELDAAAGMIGQAAASRPMRIGGGGTTSGAGYQAVRGQVSGYQPSVADAFRANSRGYAASQAESVDAEATDATAARIDRSLVRDIKAGRLSEVDRTRYANPWEQEVVQRQREDALRDAKIALNEARTDVGGSWGGSRQGVLEATLLGERARDADRVTAELRMTGFDRANDLITRDLDRDFAGQQAMMGADLDIAGRNAGYAQEVGVGNANRRTEVGVGNATRRTNVNLANTAALNDAAAFEAAAYNTAERDYAAQRGQASMHRAEAATAAAAARAAAENASADAYAGRATEAARYTAETGFHAGQNDAERGLRAAISDQAAGLQGAQQQLAAAGALGQLGGFRRQFALGNAEAVAGLGAAEQAYQQRLFDILYGDYEAERDWDLRGLQAINSTLPFVPLPKTTTRKGSSTTTKAEVDFTKPPVPGKGKT